jgi:hypothetical protein
LSAFWGHDLSGHCIVWFRCPRTNQLQMADRLLLMDRDRPASQVFCELCKCFHQTAAPEGGVPEGPTLVASFQQQEPTGGQLTFLLSVKPQRPMTTAKENEWAK